MSSRVDSRRARSDARSARADDAAPARAGRSSARGTCLVRVRELLPYAFYAASLVVMLWDVFLAGQIAQLRRAPRFFRGITALGGLLIAPAALIVVASASILNGRAIHVIAWVWPVTLGIFAIQALYAVARRLVTPFIGVPIAAYDVILAVAAFARYAAYTGRDPSTGFLAISAAESSALGLLLGRAALFSPLAVQLPLLAPAYPARWRISATVRGTLAAMGMGFAVVFLAELPSAIVAVRSYAGYSRDRLQERPRGDFTIGLRVFPALKDAPPPLALRSDLALVDSVGVGAIAVVIDPAGARLAALDSLARSLEEERRDSVLLIVAVGYDANARESFRRSPSAHMRARLAAVDRIVRKLRPDVILPARDPYTEGTRAMGRVPLAWWQEFLRLAARDAHRVSNRVRVGVAASAFTTPDSSLYAWASRPDSPIDLVGFSFYPSYDGGGSLGARLRVADRWMRGSTKRHWVFGAGAYPVAHGEPSQARALWGTLAWATSHASIKGLIVESAGDYDAVTGLRAPGGRVRPALATLERAVAAMAETVTP